MAGRGPAPKPAARRVRRHADPNPTTTLDFVRGVQPELPDGIAWHPRTVAWWRTWGESPMAPHMMDVDWSYLLDTAVLHTKLWDSGSTEAAKEVRVRVMNFGATLADRLRLRMQFAEADDADGGAGSQPTSRQRYGDLVSLPPVVGQ